MLQFGDFPDPESRSMPAARALVAAFCLLAPTLHALGQEKYALLIGIDTYQPANTTVKHPEGANTGRFAPGAPLFYNLTGPTHDVASMRGVLTSSKFGFPDDDQHIHLLENGAATRAGILAAMNKYLVEQPKKGDTVVLYVAGHGSLRVNSKSNKQTFDLAGKPTPLDNTIVPADAYLGTEDIRDREMARIFNKALDKGIYLTAIFDTCHSGGTARGAEVGPRTVPRMLAYDPRDIAEAPDVNSAGEPVIAPEDRKDNPALVLAATQVDQKAKELPDASPPHGVFTMALIDALQALPANISANDLWKRVQVDLEVQGFSDQQPVLDGTKQRRERPLFGGEPGSEKVRAAVISVDDDGVVLDIGSVADIGIGSEFVALALAQGQGERATLRITAAAGIDRSVATIVSPAEAKVAAKDVFELAKWVPAEQPSLYFWMPPSNLTQAQINSAVSEARSSGLRLVNDPSLEAWTDLISWDGSQWTMRKAGVRGAEALGPTLTAQLLQRKVAKDAVVWLNLPPPAELASQLLMNDPRSAAQSTAKEDQAMYLLAGMVTDPGAVYAWYNRGEFIAGRQTPAGYGKGCSPDSPYPIRTNWVAAGDAAATLKQLAAKLAKLHGWLELQSSVTADSDYPYHLALQRVSDGVAAEDKGSTYKGDSYQMMLQARGDTRTGGRWVYVLAIDCQGSGQLLFPLQGGGNRYPQEEGRLEQIPLPSAKFRIGPPFGTDTYVLLTTSTQLSNPDVLNFEGVVRGGERGVSSPLESLLGSTSAGTRGNLVQMPTDWGVEYLQMHSQPQKTTDTAVKHP
jgi:Caspase domain